MKTSRRIAFVIAVVVIIAGILVANHIAGPLATEGESLLYASFWSLVPPIIAIVLALITKEVYSSLFVGIVVGALFYANWNPELTLNTIFFSEGGMISKLGDSWNMGILVFLVVLGILVCLMNKAGGSAAFGRWAQQHIKTRTGAQLATMFLGILIFVDDYFNCLTVGSVMRPVTDGHKISRAKLAYLIDATAAPICIIAPISSWAAAVTSSVPDGYDINGFSMFIQTIPYNFYAILTIIMVIGIAVMKFDYGPMRIHEENAVKGDLFTTEARPYGDGTEDAGASEKGKVIDLLLPVIFLVAACIVGMVYTGGFFDGVDFITAFSECDASVGLVLGSVVTLLFTFVYYMLRGVMSFREFTDAIPNGFKAMVPAILILTFAWTLSGMTGLLGGAEYVEALVKGSAAGFQNMLPAIIFIIAGILAFATGTSWGTFGILIPIVVPLFYTDSIMLSISIAACLSGAVLGDHCSPISDTTIMASAGAQSDHVAHVSTQLPYAFTVAAVCFVNYIIVGFVRNIWICLPIAIVMMIATLLVIRALTLKKHPQEA